MEHLVAPQSLHQGGQAMTTHWQLTPSGIRRMADTPFTDHIEMAGHQLAAIVTYGVTAEGTLSLGRELCYPGLRTLPRDTFGTLHAFHPENQRHAFSCDGEPLIEYPAEFSFDGVLTMVSFDRLKRLRFTRHCFPCVEQAAYIESVTVENCTDSPLTITVSGMDSTRYARGAAGVYAIQAVCSAQDLILLPREQAVSDLVFSARLHLLPAPAVDGVHGLAERRKLVAELTDGSLTFDCPDKELCQFFRFAKLRAAESIFDTLAGPLHSPGGGPYYAAVWANDQAEYAGPFFPFMNYERANIASLNAYGLFARFMSPAYTPIPSSIIDGGQDFWEGHGDRGDAAMYLYGCSRYLLALGDRDTAQKMFWTLRWSANFTLSKKTPEGVIASDSDELEERLPSGDANLCTSSLVYGGLISAAALADELGESATASLWRSEAAALRNAIESYFGATISGYETYRYYDGNTQLRSWICIPLTMGIYDRQKGCADALLSDKLFCDDGVLSIEGDVTIWDRSTLYAFRGIFNAGESDRVYPYLRRYVIQRLLGPHVPYAVEAYPEGNQRHLSAESALFARVITEGLCGITPVGLHTLSLKPSVPKELRWVKLSQIYAGGKCFNLEIIRRADGHDIAVEWDDVHISHYIPLGDSFEVVLT